MDGDKNLIDSIKKSGNRKAADELIRKYYDKIYTEELFFKKRVYN